MVNPEVIPSQSTLPDVNGDEQVVCASRDRDGIVSDFVEGVVLFKPKDDADLQAFLDRYDGEVIDDDTIPVPPEELGITLTDEERAPTEYVVRVNVDTADLANLEANASILGLPGRLEFTSQAGMATFACVLDAKVSGFDAGTNDVYQATQALPVGAYGVYFNSQESPTGPMTYTDAFAEPRFGSTGSQSRSLSLGSSYSRARLPAAHPRSDHRRRILARFSRPRHGTEQRLHSATQSPNAVRFHRRNARRRRPQHHGLRCGKSLLLAWNGSG
ncbi:MAG: hypothetical protein R3E58_15135 [Phycisphaerae bacterium]